MAASSTFALLSTSHLRAAYFPLQQHHCAYWPAMHACPHASLGIGKLDIEFAKLLMGADAGQQSAVKGQRKA